MAESSRGIYIKAGVETTYGQEQTTRNDNLGYIQDHSLQVDNQQKKVAVIGNGRDYRYIIDGVLAVSGNFKTLVEDGRILYYAIGNLTDNGTDSYSISKEDTLKSLTLEIGDSVSSTNTIVKGVKIDTLTLSSAKEDFLNATYDWQARSIEQKTGSSTPNIPSNEPFMFWHGTVKKAGVDVADVDSFELKISNNLERLINIDSKSSGELRLIDNLIEKMRDITFRMTVNFNSFESLQDVLGGSTPADSRTDTSIQLQFTAGSRSLTITLSGVRFNTYNLSHGAEVEILNYDLDGDALDINISGTY